MTDIFFFFPATYSSYNNFREKWRCCRKWQLYRRQTTVQFCALLENIPAKAKYPEKYISLYGQTEIEVECTRAADVFCSVVRYLFVRWRASRKA